MSYNHIKFTDSLYDTWFLRTVFMGNQDSVASYKWWIQYDYDKEKDETHVPGRKVRGTDIRYVTDFKFGFTV